MPIKLSQAIIQQRLTRLRNLERMYAASKGREAVKDARITELVAIVASQQLQIDTLRIQLAELQAMVFGKKRRPPTGTAGTPPPSPAFVPKPPRTQGSYRRPLPPASAITATQAVPVAACDHCGGQLGELSTHERYVEDIPLPDLTANYQPKLTTKYLVSRGICVSCGKATSGRNLGGAVVGLGSNIRLLVCHLVSVVGMSYDQVIQLLRTLYQVVISDGEIAGILSSQHQQWLPAYAQLKANIQASSVVNADETPWPIRSEEGRGYSWALSDALSPKVCFTLVGTRGAIHAQNLFGDSFTGVRISDDYAPYRTDALPGRQQLCWAHLYRCIRDVRYNSNLPEEQLPYVAKWYEAFAEIYQDLRQYLEKPYGEATRRDQTRKLWGRVQKLANESPPRHTGEPEKLTRLKAQLLRAGQNRLFTCLLDNTPCDNNRAERDLRPLVLKRKRSFGSQTLKGATALSTILSLCTTTWRMEPENYFRVLAGL